jgi:elongation factor 1-alpha
MSSLCDKPPISVVVIGSTEFSSETSAIVAHVLDQVKVANELRKTDDGSSSHEAKVLVLVDADDRIVWNDVDQIMNTKQHTFETERYLVTMKDASTDLAISQADVTVLVVEDNDTDDAGSFLQQQSSIKELALVTYTLGVKHVVCVCNNTEFLDSFVRLRNQVSLVLRHVGYKPMKIPFIPMSLMSAKNETLLYVLPTWYQGPTLLDALNQVSEPKRRTDKPLRLCVETATTTADGTLANGTLIRIRGKVETGVLRVGSNVQCTSSATSLQTAKVVSIQLGNRISVREAEAGYHVSFTVADDVVTNHIRSGDVVSDPDNHPAAQVTSFEGQIIIMDNQQPDAFIIRNGYTAVLGCHTARVTCVFARLKQTIDKKTGHVIQEEPESVCSGDACRVVLQPLEPLCVDAFADFPSLGRFIVRDLDHRIVAVGIVLSIETTASDTSRPS